MLASDSMRGILAFGCSQTISHKLFYLAAFGFPDAKSDVIDVFARNDV